MENIKNIIDSIFLAIAIDDESLEKYIIKLKRFPLETLSSYELDFVLQAIEEIEKQLEEKKNKTLQALEEKEYLKKFQF